MPRLTEAMQPETRIPIQDRKCQTCQMPLAIETRTTAGSELIEEVIYFCVNREKRCPMAGMAQ